MNAYIHRQVDMVIVVALVAIVSDIHGQGDRIPTGRWQASWLFTSVGEELNRGLPTTTPASGQNGT